MAGNGAGLLRLVVTIAMSEAFEASLLVASRGYYAWSHSQVQQGRMETANGFPLPPQRTS